MASRSLNKVLLIGNLTRDPELRYTPSGTPVCTFGLATNRSWVAGEGGERQEETEFHRIVAWHKLAELCAQLLFKGRKVYIEGRLQTRTWTGPDGQERSATEVVAENMIVLDSRKKGEREEVKEEEGEIAAPATNNTTSQKPTTAAPSQTGKKTNKTDKKEEEGSEEEPATNKEEIKEEVGVDDIPF